MVPGSGRFGGWWLQALSVGDGLLQIALAKGQSQFGSLGAKGMVRPTPLTREKLGTVRKAPDDERGPDS